MEPKVFRITFGKHKVHFFSVISELPECRSAGVCHHRQKSKAALTLMWRHCNCLSRRHPKCQIAPKKDNQFDNFVVTGGTVSCRYDNLRCHQWRQSYQIDTLLFSVFRCVYVLTEYAMKGGFMYEHVLSTAIMNETSWRCNTWMVITQILSNSSKYSVLSVKADNLQTLFLNSFSWMKIVVSVFKILPNFIIKGSTGDK